jgi:hypothetical protein
MYGLCIDCHLHTTRYAATSKKVAVSKHVAKSIGVHVAHIVTWVFHNVKKLVYSNDL